MGMIKVIMAISFEEMELASDKEIKDTIIESLDTSNISVEFIRIER